MQLSKRLPITVNGKACELAFDFAAMRSLEKDCGIVLATLGKTLQQLKAGTPGIDALELLGKLVFAMTRSSDNPPTVKDLERMSPEEFLLLRDTIMSTIATAHDGGLGKGRATAERGAAAGAKNGIGTRRSKSRSASAASRRRNSGA